MKWLRSLTLTRSLPYILLVGGVIGVFCSGVLTVDKIHLLKNPGGQLGCDINPVIACGSVINTPQASVFGFPNPLIGLVGFGMVAVIGAALLAGATFKRWYWLCVQAGVLFGVCFVTWLQFQSLYRIGALCPYCMGVWAVMIPIFWYTTLYNVREGHVRVSARLNGLAAFLQRHHGDVLVMWYLVIIGLIAHRFWYYWSTLL